MSQTRKVAYWPLADIPAAAINVRFRVKAASPLPDRCRATDAIGHVSAHGPMQSARQLAGGERDANSSEGSLQKKLWTKK